AAFAKYQLFALDDHLVEPGHGLRHWKPFQLRTGPQCGHCASSLCRRNPTAPQSCSSPERLGAPDCWSRRSERPSIPSTTRYWRSLTSSARPTATTLPITGVLLSAPSKMA